jgi:hypothetical protein
MARKYSASAFEHLYNKIVEMPPMITKKALVRLLVSCQLTFKAQIIRAYEEGYKNYTIPRRYNWTGLKYYEVKYGTLRRTKAANGKSTYLLTSKVSAEKKSPFLTSSKNKKQTNE